MSSNLSLRVVRGDGTTEDVAPDGRAHLRAVPPPDVTSLRDYLRMALPRRSQPKVVRRWKLRNLPNIVRGLAHLAVARAATALTGIAHPEGVLFLTVLRGDGTVEELGLASLRVVTDVGCQKIVAVMNTSDAVTAVNFKYHGIGTGTTAEATTDTTLVTELTTEYLSDNVRPTGSQTTGATSKIFYTAATITLDSGTPAVTEHGIFSQAATGGGSLLDRSKFSAINLVGANGDGITAQYSLTFTSGG